MAEARRQVSPQLKSYLFIFCNLLLGFAVIGVFELLTLPYKPAFIFSGFLLLNLLYVLVFRLKQELLEYWSPVKIPQFVLAAVAGICLALLPLLIQGHAGPTLNSWSVPGLLLTLCTVGWEELWFRGIFLNYCKRHVPAITLSLFMGGLFMALHILNPAIHLLLEGPALFFAGALLTLLYFYYKSIWVPLGLHFGNNICGALIKTGQAHDTFRGGDGYFQALLLAILFIGFAIRLKRKKG